jgi:hypothetical protein
MSSANSKKEERSSRKPTADADAPAICQGAPDEPKQKAKKEAEPTCTLACELLGDDLVYLRDTNGFSTVVKRSRISGVSISATEDVTTVFAIEPPLQMKFHSTAFMETVVKTIWGHNVPITDAQSKVLAHKHAKAGKGGSSDGGGDFISFLRSQMGGGGDDDSSSE